MSKLEDLLREGVAARRAPFVVGIAGNSRGVVWSGSSGVIAGQVLSEKTVFRIVSMSKAIGATAAAILATRGQLDWRTPINEILPDFGEIRVLTGYQNEKPHLRAPRTQATLQQLATHTSGLVYGFWDRDIARYLQDSGLPPVVSGMNAALTCPMAFDPGQRWQYGSGVDWLGLVVEKIDGRRIDQFCQEEIFQPLAMRDTRFELERDMEKRLAPVFARSAEGYFTAPPIDVGPPSQPEFYGMGHSLYSTAADYMRFLRMWLNLGELDGLRLLNADQATHFLFNHIGSLRMEPLKTTFPQAVLDLDILPEFEKSHSLGFGRMEASVPGMRSSGSQFWGGVLNTHFWFDPAKDVAGILMTQLLPFLDPGFTSLFAEFERYVYANMIS